ncbi:MAG: proline dehydrogenase [Acidobacteria bacterium]|nr:proline dehydrogenase [Acidobacteriota bacterium]MYJ05810.1 proline dehydrogenase [Acidobacteriota bacterium]
MLVDRLSRWLFLTAADSRLLKAAATRYGMRGPGSPAGRFIGGRDIPEAIESARALEQRGMTHTFNYLGEHVRTTDAAAEATMAYERVIDEVRAAGMECNLSIKLTQLGLELDPGLCEANLEQILDRAGASGCFVRVDMEHSALLEETLRITVAAHARHPDVGTVLQSMLRRTPDDLARLNEAGVPVRLVKGAYREEPDIAFPEKRDVDRAFIRLAETMLEDGAEPAFGTHDPRMIRAVNTAAAARGISAERYEFQMLYGVRRDLQAALGARGYGIRIYLPFGADWFPYFMRRLAERPANVLFVVRSLLHEQLGAHRP